eukprot:Gb_23958 [translate_table: standard]
MAQTLPSISIADKYCPSLKRFNAFVFKPLNTLSACANFSTSRTSSNSMLLMSPWRINSFIQPWKNEPILPKSSTFNTGLPKKTISAAYGSGIGMSRSNNFNRLGKCLVVPPLPRGRKPRAIIKFLGGAFIGAVPERTYSLFMDLLAKEGFLIVAVPYNVTFEHAQAAKEVYKKFNDCMDILSTSGFSPANLTPSDILELPVYCVGHRGSTLFLDQSIDLSHTFIRHSPKNMHVHALTYHKYFPTYLLWDHLFASAFSAHHCYIEMDWNNQTPDVGS